MLGLLEDKEENKGEGVDPKPVVVSRKENFH